MNLTKGEFSLFNTSSQIQLLSEKGIAIAKLKISENKELRIYLIFDFFVEVFYDTEIKKIERINLCISGIPEMFFE